MNDPQRPTYPDDKINVDLQWRISATSICTLPCCIVDENASAFSVVWNRMIHNSSKFRFTSSSPFVFELLLFFFPFPVAYGRLYFRLIAEETSNVSIAQESKTPKGSCWIDHWLNLKSCSIDPYRYWLIANQLPFQDRWCWLFRRIIVSRYIRLKTRLEINVIHFKKFYLLLVIEVCNRGVLRYLDLKFDVYIRIER